MRSIHFYIIVMLISFTACQENPSTDTEPVDQRRNESKKKLIDLLTSAPEGWKTNYKANSQVGSIFILMKFSPNGEVRIRSNLSANGGVFFDQTIFYRVDTSMATELIFENYSIFHYFFELSRTSHGGEFEFITTAVEDNQITLTSKTDQDDISVMTLTKAQASDTLAINAEIAENLSKMTSLGPYVQQYLYSNISRLLMLPRPQHIVFKDKGISIFIELGDFLNQIAISATSSGTNIDQILADNVFIYPEIKYSSYHYKGDKIIFNPPLSFTVEDQSYTLTSITPTQLSLTGSPFCLGSTENTSIYSGISELGAIEIHQSLLSGLGKDFQIKTDTSYYINSTNIIIYDETSQQLKSLVSEEPYNTSFITPKSFHFNFGFQSDEYPKYAVGLEYEDADKNTKTILQKIVPTETRLNRIKIELLDEVFVKGEATESEINHLKLFNETLFEGNTIYVYYFPNTTSLTVWWLYNPCNQYEFLLIGNPD